MRSPGEVSAWACSATAWPARRITASSLWPEAQVAFSHSRICATVMTGTGINPFAYLSACLMTRLLCLSGNSCGSSRIQVPNNFRPLKLGAWNLELGTFLFRQHFQMASMPERGEACLALHLVLAEGGGVQ